MIWTTLEEKETVCCFLLIITEKKFYTIEYMNVKFLHTAFGEKDTFLQGGCQGGHCVENKKFDKCLLR